VARAIAGELGLRLVSADAVRQSLFGAAKHPAGYGEGVYTAEANRLTYQKMIEEARARLSDDGSVVLDATFRHAEARAMAREMAQGTGAEWRLIECRLMPELVRTRLTERAARKEGLSDATWETYLRQQAEDGPQCAANDSECLVIDTGGNLSAIAHTATDWLRR
jgi:predicted kinase